MKLIIVTTNESVALTNTITNQNQIKDRQNYNKKKKTQNLIEYPKYEIWSHFEQKKKKKRIRFHYLTTMQKT